MKTFCKSDGWLFATLFYFQNRKLKLSSLIEIGNVLNHAIFELDQINGGLSRLEIEEFIQFKNGCCSFTPKGKLFYKAHRKRFESCSPSCGGRLGS